MGESMIERTRNLLTKPCDEAREELEKMIQNRMPGKQKVQEDAFGFFSDEDEPAEMKNNEEVKDVKDVNVDEQCDQIKNEVEDHDEIKDEDIGMIIEQDANEDDEKVDDDEIKDKIDELDNLLSSAKKSNT